LKKIESLALNNKVSNGLRLLSLARQESLLELNFDENEFRTAVSQVTAWGGGSLIWNIIKQTKWAETPLGEEAKSTFNYFALQTTLIKKEAHKVFDFLKSEVNVEPVLFKGLAIAEKYPQPGMRPASDIDLAVDPEHYEKVFEMLNSRLKTNYFIDLHQGFRHLDTITWTQLLDRSEYLPNSVIKIPSEEDHLRILTTHWLTDGGAHPVKLLDIAFAVKNRNPNFDWDRCLNPVSVTRKTWVVTAIVLAHIFLGLELDDTPVAKEVDKLPKWVIPSIIKEWQNPIKLKGLNFAWSDRREFWQQILKRFPPNPIQATIELEKPIDEVPRWRYQLANFFSRIKPSLKRLRMVIRNG
jgi:hypothetical protein